MKSGVIFIGWLWWAVILSLHGADLASKLELDGVHVGDTVQRQLALPNKTSNALTVREVNSSCSCLRIVGFSRTIAADENGTLTVEYKPTRPGRTEIEILVALYPANTPPLEFRWVGEIFPALPAGASPDDHAPQIASGTSAPARVEASDNFVLAKDLTRVLAESHAMLVDIRDPPSYHLGSIDGATNWPVNMLRTFASLKARPLILAGSGGDDATVLQAVLELRQAGFQSVKVLRGGVRMAWVENPGIAHPPVPASVSVALVAPVDFLTSSQNEWLIVHLRRATGAAPMVPAIPGAIDLAPGADIAAAVRQQAQQATAAKPVISKILIASDDGSAYEAVEGALPMKDLGLPVFYLKGGALAYQAAIQQGLAQRNQRSAKVSSTGYVRGTSDARVFSPGGCKTCPK